MDSIHQPLITSVPEIVHKFMSFLPTDDLLTCTSINFAWEGEARKHIRARGEVELSNASFPNYVEIMQVRSNYFERLKFGWKHEIQFSELLSHLERLAVNYTGKLKQLDVAIPFNEITDLHRLFPVLHLLGKNLKSLGLCLFDTYGQFAHDEKMSAFFTNFDLSNILLPTITKLTIHPFHSYKIDRKLYAPFLTKLAPMFPNVSALSYSNPDVSELESFLNSSPPPFPKLVSLATNCDFYVGEVSVGLNLGWEFIKKFEFDAYSDGVTFEKRFLPKLAPTLEFLHINNLDREPNSLLIPIMPRLRVFAVTFREWRGCYFRSRLKFETADVAKEVKIEYDKQFPSLEKISVRFQQKVKTLEGRKSGFEASARFLYWSFLPKKAAVCETVHELDIQFPPKRKFKLVKLDLGTRAGCPYGKCNRFDWEDSKTFLDRVAATFPNVKYHILEERRGKLRQTLMQKWIQEGVNLGFLKTKEGDAGWWKMSNVLLNVEDKGNDGPSETN
ncbi:uncharacterized protein LOC118438729 [Folsomia candida]|nr:uncharacterized protein LOC118438729 [Folsomia candida]